MLALISCLMPSWIASILPSWFHPGSTLLGLALGIAGTMYLQFWREVEEDEQEERHNWHSGNWWSQQWAYRDPSMKWKQRFGDGNDDDDPYDEFDDTCTRANHLDAKHLW